MGGGGGEGGGLERPRVSIVKIDVEGWEVAVLGGMRALLGHGMVALVVFETGSTWEDDRAAAPGTGLESVVTNLGELGYRCFYFGIRFLHPLSPPLWHPVCV